MTDNTACYKLHLKKIILKNPILSYDFPLKITFYLLHIFLSVVSKLSCFEILLIHSPFPLCPVVNESKSIFKVESAALGDAVSIYAKPGSDAVGEHICTLPTLA